MPLLNGKIVSAETIDPAKHRYVGMFRPPVDPFADADCYCMCRCGRTLVTREESTEHYRRGCHDSPQYVDIEAQKNPDPTGPGFPW